MICPCLAVSSYLLAYSAFRCECEQTNRFLCRSRRNNHYFAETRVSSACWDLYQEESAAGGGIISLAIIYYVGEDLLFRLEGHRRRKQERALAPV